LPVQHFAAIDMGTNSFHLIIAEVFEDGSIDIVDRQREVIRLASRQGENLNIISEDEIRLAVALLRSFKKLAGLYNAKLIAVATSAVREAENRDVFIARVRAETGITVNVLPGYKEAELIYKGAEKALSLKDRNTLCIDIGGGSSEIINSVKGKIKFAESIKIGAVRLSKKFFPGFIISEDSINLCREFAEAEILKNNKIRYNADYEIAVGASGTILSVARAIAIRKNQSAPIITSKLSFTSNELDEFYRLVMSKKTVDERLTIAGIEEKRADILPAGLIILTTIFKLFGIRELFVSEYALREGVILQEINQ
jgi:exopolyphosphatase/guanosine-5'-triphosphate,3'-diphosphate pyrophosphatase